MTHCKKVYGLTGSISTGKSTVSNLLRNKGYKIVDMDKVAREIFKIGKPAYEEILEIYGREILDGNLEIDRKKLRAIVFSSEARLKELNKITHPYIMEESKELMEEILKTEDLVFLDIPLLIETREELRKHGIDFHKIILVYVDEETQLNRLILRDKISREEALKIINSQMSIEKKREFADYIIDNTGSLESLLESVDKFIDSIN